MKNIFFLGMIGLTAVAVVGYFVWLVIRASYQVYEDWQLGKELDAITAESRARRRQQSQTEEPAGEESEK